MRALITRPREDAEPVARALAGRGFSVMIEPLLEILRDDNAPLPPLDGLQGVLATSANGVRAFAARTERRDLPVWAVGEATAREATTLGFEAVEAAGGDVTALAALVTETLDPAAGPLLHVAGAQVAGDLSGLLVAAGFKVERAVLYNAQAAGRLSPQLLDALDRNAIDIALFFSPRTAAGFVFLAHAAGRADACRNVTAYGLSRACAVMLSRITWRRLRAAAVPTQESLLAAIDEDAPLLAGRA